MCPLSGEKAPGKTRKATALQTSRETSEKLGGTEATMQRRTVTAREEGRQEGAVVL